MSASAIPPFLSRLPAWIWHLLLIAVATALVYYPSLNVPFYMDDFSSIQENPRIYDWQGIGALWQYAPLRLIGYLSFAANYQLDQFNPLGYHLVNILVHFLAASAFYALLAGLLRTPRLDSDEYALARRWLPLLAALIFALHPLHLQAVTYIVQRLAAMAALFYLAAMASFVFARLAQSARQRWLWAAACLLFALLALFTKQNTATLPLALFLLELLFFTDSAKRLLQIAAAAVGLPLLLWALLVGVFDYQPFSLQAMEAMTRETTEISRADYLAVQMPVLWRYIGWFFWPSGLHLDHANPPLTGFGDGGVIFALLAHLAVIGAALAVLRRWPLVAFAILFYYLAHSVESSVIPIRDVIFEHRAYLPDIGLSLLVAWLLLVFAARWLHGQVLLLLGIALLIALGYATWQRNILWQQPIALWENNARLSPDKPRSWSILGKHYLQAGRVEEGVQALTTAIQKQNQQASTVNTTDVVNLIVGYKMLKRYPEALALTEQVLKQPMEPFLRAKFLINRGNIYFDQGQLQAAEASIREALRVFPSSIIARANLASVLGNSGRWAEAEQLYVEALQFDPDNQAIRANLAKLRQIRQQQEQMRQKQLETQ